MQIQKRDNIIINIENSLRKYHDHVITKDQLLAYLEMCGYVDRYTIEDNYLTIYLTKPYRISDWDIPDIGEPL